MGKPGATGVKRIFKAAIYSKQGLKAGLKYEAALRQELALGIVLTLLAFAVAESTVEFLLLVLLPWLTFVVEILNSAIEAVVDRFGDEYHELSGRAKDLGSAAVMVMLFLTGLTWLAILIW
ncbi:MAG: diacylglycerol kinase [Candidatus Anaerobiospirillum pullicola]|uniref:Diacylglycerol kinase n=1 Tax=Candidatus Anaerobiospirillum pullicola TaxID=2838451 RepID=A0A948WZZ4_9GAMM|nr:diacylglycerol kinase [Candidatus Anaerobiospirillum pullicola]